MRDQEKHATVTRLVDIWQKRLSLNHWSIEIVNDETIWPESAMDIKVSSKYNRATIRYCEIAFDHYGPDNITENGEFAWGGTEYSVVHELCHIIAAELGYVADFAATVLEGVHVYDMSKAVNTMSEKAEEQLCEQLTRIFLGATYEMDAG
ncbi:MAG: hypothetical protein JW384_01412 [Nitrosomonadaceae bacterium]|nr:hypothetical protein [Nitrosomonadaceae bacterium]